MPRASIPPLSAPVSLRDYDPDTLKVEAAKDSEEDRCCYDLPNGAPSHSLRSAQ
ncbi:MAG: hypothetical protein J7551_05325 [Chloroflexi bacterium]|jgi:hypothetical protein|nr:hypothetical protein [Chloroflexota bacterium]